MKNKQIIILGVGNILLTDEGFGVHVVNRLKSQYRFPEKINLIDGNVSGLNLLETILDSDYLIIVDTIQNNGPPGTSYCLKGGDIPERMTPKNSLHQIDLFEVLALCRAVGHLPETVIYGVEPEDIETFNDQLSPKIFSRVGETVQKILNELEQMGITYKEMGTKENVPGNPLENC
jgi:hydrogenase maturation protease